MMGGMRIPASALPLICLSLTISLCSGCSDSGLQVYKPAQITSVDDKLEIDAHVCTSLPAAENFPVKVLLIVDASDTMGHCSDTLPAGGGERRVAAEKLIQQYSGNTAVSFAVITFGSEMACSGTDKGACPAVFQNQPDLVAIDAMLQAGDGPTDYNGVLGAAYSTLAADMQMVKDSSPGDLPRSKYVVIFFTDGFPDPQCAISDSLPPSSDCCNDSSTPDCLALGPRLACYCERSDWTKIFPNLSASQAMNDFPELELGSDYNQPDQIYQEVDNIISLEDIYHVGEVRLHTDFLYYGGSDPAVLAQCYALVAGPGAAEFAAARIPAEMLLQGMAMHGNGTFTEYSDNSKINFFNVNYTSLKATNAMSTFFAWNQNYWPHGDALEIAKICPTQQFSDGGVGTGTNDPDIDTDGDGLPDSIELCKKYCYGQNPGCGTPTDSDGDGYSDYIEYQNMQAGFDPADPKKPATPCTATDDFDGDGLKDCEEAVIGTDRHLFDTDGDHIPDFIEVLAGMNPLDGSDAFEDANHNNVRNFDEVRAHLNPQLPPDSTANSYVNELIGTTQMDDGRTCYDIAVRNIQMVTTGAGTKGVRGENRVLLNFLESPVDRPGDSGNLHIACVDARYIDGVIKSPASGIVHLTDAQFHLSTLSNVPGQTKFDPDTDCIDLTSLTAPPDGGPNDGGAHD